MNSVIEQTPRSINPYPKLMRSKNYGVVYLVRAVGSGVVVHGGRAGGIPLGQYYETLNLSELEDFHGIIKLSND